MKSLPSDWASIFQPETALLELIARGSTLYFAILVFLRIMPRRTGGELATMDLIFVVLIAEAAAHALGDYTSVADGIVVIATLMGWNYLVNALSCRVPFIERFVSSPPPASRPGRPTPPPEHAARVPHRRGVDESPPGARDRRHQRREGGVRRRRR